MMMTMMEEGKRMRRRVKNRRRGGEKEEEQQPQSNQNYVTATVKEALLRLRESSQAEQIESLQKKRTHAHTHSQQTVQV